MTLSIRHQWDGSEAAEGLPQILNQRPVERGLTIDDWRTKRCDDGVLIMRHEQGWDVWVSIVDIPAFVSKGSRLDSQAASVGQNYRDALNQKYMTVIPDYLAFHAAGFKQNELRPAVTFHARLDKDFNVITKDINRTAFQSVKKCTYDYIDERYQGNDNVVAEWFECAAGLKRKRLSAVTRMAGDILKEEILPSGSVPDHLFDVETADDFVREMMLFSCHLADLYLKEHNLPVINRLKKATVKIFGNPDDQSLRKAVKKRGWDIARQLNHAILPTVSITSPMRKYADLVMLRTIAEHISNGTVSYDQAELDEIERQLKIQDLQIREQELLRSGLDGNGSIKPSFRRQAARREGADDDRWNLLFRSLKQSGKPFDLCEAKISLEWDTILRIACVQVHGIKTMGLGWTNPEAASIVSKAILDGHLSRSEIRQPEMA